MRGCHSLKLDRMTVLRVLRESAAAVGWGHDRSERLGADERTRTSTPFRANGLTKALGGSYTGGMEVHLTPETESRLNELATKTGRPADELVEDAMAGYLKELAGVRDRLDSRYDDIKSGTVKPMDGEEAFARLRHKSEERRSERS